MSLGSISTESHETLAVAMNRLGGKSTPEREAKTYPLPAARKWGLQALSDQTSSFGSFRRDQWYLPMRMKSKSKSSRALSQAKGANSPEARSISISRNYVTPHRAWGSLVHRRIMTSIRSRIWPNSFTISKMLIPVHALGEARFRGRGRNHRCRCNQGQG